MLVLVVITDTDQNNIRPEFGIPKIKDHFDESKKRTINDKDKKIKELEKTVSLVQSKQPQSQPSQTTTTNDIQILDTSQIESLQRVKELGNGASGTVYEVYRIENIKQTYVLKVMNQISHENFQHFIKEHEILSMLNHPNVLKTFGIFLSDDNNPLSIVLEYCQNDLDKRIIKKVLNKTEIPEVLLRFQRS